MFAGIVFFDEGGIHLDGGVERHRKRGDLRDFLKDHRVLHGIGGVVHTHSPHATAWAQAGRPIPNIGTTHADTFYADVPVTDEIPTDRIREAYEEATGDVIVETFSRLRLDPVATPGALAVHHGPFTWGRDAADAVEHAVILEEVAKIASLSVALNPAIQMNRDLIEKHYSRKHGPKAYYGQKGENS